ncbi:ABC transporter substrate-binding protein [Anaerobium acetethylicum]|uniref:Multiple sugar transport system substrate-binding protein n=1 Tax=Anaerobium acetethylicum TaxID=1619234 RepID=A0A1D3TW28_9FIRM|nr:ABC transporter substrate-binding protein [Anaerobium acetethylicum]SCP98385.1 multiple sugar transport system substrate-binding protein [Anaerobium acetethylicum]
MKKKILSLTMAAVLAVGTLVGCGSSSSGSKEESTTTEKTEDLSEASGDKITLQLWHYFTSADLDDFEKVIADYNASQDNVEVVSTYVAREDLMNQYTMGAISGELPDIGMIDSPDMASYIQMGVYENIQDLCDEWGEVDNFYKGPLNSCTGTDGNLYGLPHNTNSISLFYNKDLLDAAGCEVPETWDELEEVAAKVTTSDTYGLSICARGDEEGTFQFIPWLYSAGGSIDNINSTESVSALTYLTDMVNNGYMSKEVINWTQNDAKDNFVAGKCAMMINGPWQVPEVEKATFNWGVALLPKDKEFASCMGGENFGVCAGTEYKEEAFNFLTYMLSKDVSAEFCKTAGKFPTRGDAMDILETSWAEDSPYRVFAEEMNYTVARGPHAEWPTISEAVYTAYQAAYIGDKTPQEALDEAAEKIASVWKQ